MRGFGVVVSAADAAEVGPGAEGLLAGAAENDHADLAVPVGAAEALAELADGVKGQGVALGFAVDRHPGDVVTDLVANFGRWLIPGLGHLGLPGGLRRGSSGRIYRHLLQSDI